MVNSAFGKLGCCEEMDKFQIWEGQLMSCALKCVDSRPCAMASAASGPVLPPPPPPAPVPSSAPPPPSPSVDCERHILLKGLKARLSGSSGPAVAEKRPPIAEDILPDLPPVPLLRSKVRSPPPDEAQEYPVRSRVRLLFLNRFLSRLPASLAVRRPVAAAAEGRADTPNAFV